MPGGADPADQSPDSFPFDLPRVPLLALILVCSGIEGTGMTPNHSE